MSKYQPFHDLPASQYEALKADIESHGVLVPIVVDEAGDVIDGHQRRKVCAELHINYPTTVMSGLSEDEKQALAIALNAFRRHLSGVERSQAIGKLEALGWSIRRIAEAVGVHHTTIVKQRQRLQNSGGESSPPDEADSSSSRDSVVEPQVRQEAAAPDDDAGVRADSPSPEPNPAPRVTGKDGKSYPRQRQPAPRPKRASTTKAVALALYKLAEAAEAFEAIDPKRLAEYADEVPVWSGNLAESLKVIETFDQQLKEISDVGA